MKLQVSLVPKIMTALDSRWKGRAMVTHRLIVHRSVLDRGILSVLPKCKGHKFHVNVNRLTIGTHQR